MAKRRVVVEVECGEKTCQECAWNFCGACGLFYKERMPAQKKHNLNRPRLLVCLAAERAAEVKEKGERR